MKVWPIETRFFSGSQTPSVLEDALDLLCLARAQQSVVDEDAVESLSERPVEQCRDHGGVDAARHAADDLARAHPVADLRDLRLDELVHAPAARESGHPEQEVLEHPLPALGVRDFRVELESEDRPLAVANGGEGAVLGGAEHAEARGELGHVIPVAHPDHGGGLDPFEQPVALGNGELGAAVLPLSRGLDAPAEVLDEQLLAVADAEDRDAQLEQVLVEGRRPGRTHAAGPAREDHRPGCGLPDPGRLDPRRHDLAVDGQLAHATRDELRVLRSVIDDQDLLAGRH
jgi:hypothetical protein